MTRWTLPLLAALAVSACTPESRCVRGIEAARADLEDVRDSKSGLAKASPSLLKASALLGAAEVARAAKNYDGCIENVRSANEAIQAAEN